MFDEMSVGELNYIGLNVLKQE